MLVEYYEFLKSHLFFNAFPQHAKKVVSDSLGLVDFAIGLVNSVLNLPNGQVIFRGNTNYPRTVINPAHQILFG